MSYYKKSDEAKFALNMARSAPRRPRSKTQPKISKSAFRKYLPYLIRLSNPNIRLSEKRQLLRTASDSFIKYLTYLLKLFINLKIPLKEGLRGQLKTCIGRGKIPCLLRQAIQTKSVSTKREKLSQTGSGLGTIISGIIPSVLKFFGLD